MRRRVRQCCLWLGLVFAVAPAAWAQSYGPMRAERPLETGLPATLRDVGIDQRLGAELPLDASFTDEHRQRVALGRYFGARPVILAFVYFDCPMLCNQVLTGLVGSLKGLGFTAGKEFEVVAVSFDPREPAGMAAAKKQWALDRYQRASGAQGWHFLTGDEANIRRVTDAAGFKFKWDSVTSQFAHASGVMIVTPGGRMARYFYGIEYAPRDLRLGLVEAAGGKIGSPVDALLLYCYHYDPLTGRYSAVVINILRLAGVLFLVLAAACYFLLWRHGPKLKERVLARAAGRLNQTGGAAR